MGMSDFLRGETAAVVNHADQASLPDRLTRALVGRISLRAWYEAIG